MVRTLQSELRKQKRIRTFGGYHISAQKKKKPCGQFAMQHCASRAGKVQEAGYSFNQTAAYVRSKVQ